MKPQAAAGRPMRPPHSHSQEAVMNPLAELFAIGCLTWLALIVTLVINHWRSPRPTEDAGSEPEV
jgi:hypothetical protein